MGCVLVGLMALTLIPLVAYKAPNLLTWAVMLVGLVFGLLLAVNLSRVLNR
jgi:prepilin signal peptidase PulO-like enzyme (type II secretory pathway)